MLFEAVAEEDGLRMIKIELNEEGLQFGLTQDLSFVRAVTLIEQCDAGIPPIALALRKDPAVLIIGYPATVSFDDLRAAILRLEPILAHEIKRASDARTRYTTLYATSAAMP